MELRKRPFKEQVAYMYGLFVIDKIDLEKLILHLQAIKTMEDFENGN